MNKIDMIILNTFLILTLSACSSMNSSFDCPNQAGVLCKNLDQINRMVDSEEINPHKPRAATYLKARSLEFQAYPYPLKNFSHTPLRSGDTVQRMWIAPYEDNEGNYHEDSVVYIVMQKGQWRAISTKAA